MHATPVEGITPTRRTAGIECYSDSLGVTNYCNKRGSDDGRGEANANYFWAFSSAVCRNLKCNEAAGDAPHTVVMESMSLKPELFEGMRFDFTKGLSPRFSLSHSVFMGPTEIPSQSPETIKIPTAHYEFGANFIDPKVSLASEFMYNYLSRDVTSSFGYDYILRQWQQVVVSDDGGGGNKHWWSTVIAGGLSRSVRGSASSSEGCGGVKSRIWYKMQGGIQKVLSHGGVLKNAVLQHIRLVNPVARPLLFPRYESVASARMEEHGFESTTISDILKAKGKSADGSWLWCATEDTVYDAVKSTAELTAFVNIVFFC
ncbi:hypothetical protein Vadar_028514 [Vaccinium darrowii]|uniref:Uncharacterized protein n=1 Tax=Vaccinium darrowii TaxID=229202 RepID=A0ACB7XCV0_9ERIC|nr:hypothetical protein Vadar_028514 [Vaccinium darrowii]